MPRKYLGGDGGVSPVGFDMKVLGYFPIITVGMLYSVLAYSLFLMKRREEFVF
jgi:hypothetical protein